MENSPYSIPTINSDSIQEIKRRTLLDFSLGKDQVKDQLRTAFGELSDSTIEEWVRSGKLEMKVIDGEKRYFKNSVSNLQRLLTFDSELGKHEPFV